MAGSRGKPKTISKSATAGYSGPPLPKKLGIGPDFKVHLIGAPAGFESTLGELEDGARLIRRTLQAVYKKPQDSNLSLWFVESVGDLESGVRYFSENCPSGGMWIIWKKKSALKGIRAENAISENLIREIALPAGLVDFKVCAVDATWSGLKLTKRKAAKAGQD